MISSIVPIRLPHHRGIRLLCLHPPAPGMAVLQPAFDGFGGPGHCAEHLHGRARADCRRLDLHARRGHKGISHRSLGERRAVAVCDVWLRRAAPVLRVEEPSHQGRRGGIQVLIDSGGFVPSAVPEYVSWLLHMFNTNCQENAEPQRPRPPIPHAASQTPLARTPARRQDACSSAPRNRYAARDREYYWKTVEDEGRGYDSAPRAPTIV